MALKKLVSDLTQGLIAYPNHNTPSDSGGFNYGSSTSIFDTLIFRQRSFSYSNPLSFHDNPEPLLPQLLPGVNDSTEGSIFYMSDAPDGFIRGGEMNALKRAALDNLRINRFYQTGEGLAFIVNQKGLQKSNPIIQESGPGTITSVIDDILGGFLGTPDIGDFTNRTFNEQNLIKQITEGGYTGVYYNRAGQDPFTQAAEQFKYSEVHKPGRKFDANTVGSFNNLSGLRSGNRLISLGKKLQAGTPQSFNLTGGSIMEQALGIDLGGLFSIVDTGLQNLQNFFSDPLGSLSQPQPFGAGSSILYQYTGGPGSTYGIGDTILYRYHRTSGEYDHQGHPLSIPQYFTNTVTTQGGDLDVITGAINENLFGGNQILGQNSIFLDPNGGVTTNSFFGGLANHIFGAETVDFVSNLFSGQGIGGVNTSNSYPNVIQIGTVSGQNLSNPIANLIDGRPKNAYIQHPKSRIGGKVVEGTNANKPDAIAGKISNNSYPTSLGKIIGGGPRSYINAIDSTTQARYKPKLADFVKDAAKNSTNNNYSKYFNQTTKSGRKYLRETRIGAGDPGGWGITAGEDKINSLDIHEVTDGAFGDDKYRDFVRFRIEAVNTDAPNKSDVMIFRAFLDNFTDNYRSNWNSFKYNGRGEEFFTYNSFKRTFSISFKVAAQTEVEMKPIYRKLNYLVSNMAPDYSNTGRMRAPYIKLCVGAYMDRVPGFLTSINIKWGKNYPWEIAMTSPENEGNGKHVLPHVLDVSLNFQPIHDFLPKKSIEEAPFILPGDNTNLYGGPWLTGADKQTAERSVSGPAGDTRISGNGGYMGLSSTGEPLMETINNNNNNNNNDQSNNALLKQNAQTKLNQVSQQAISEILDADMGGPVDVNIGMVMEDGGAWVTTDGQVVNSTSTYSNQFDVMNTPSNPDDDIILNIQGQNGSWVAEVTDNSGLGLDTQTIEQDIYNQLQCNGLMINGANNFNGPDLSFYPAGSYYDTNTGTVITPTVTNGNNSNSGGSSGTGGTGGVWGCFKSGTPIEMFNGTFKNIEDIKKGDIIKSYKEGKYTSGIVTRHLTHPVNDVIPVVSLDGIIGSTDHPIFINNEWYELSESPLEKTISNMFIDNWYNLEIDGYTIHNSEHNYIIKGYIMSGLGDNEILNNTFSRQKRFQTLNI